MSFFKKKVSLENFCCDFYDNQILNPKMGNMEVGSVFSDVVIKEVAEVDPTFNKVDKQKLANELIVIRFELFALAWTHKFISGENVVIQSAFTKKYLHEKDMNDVWSGMEPYNNMIDGVTLHCLTSQGNINLSFNYNTREDLTAENIEAAKKLGIENDDTVARVNHRLWSENAWKQKLMLGPLVFTFCEQLGIDANNLADEAQFRLAVVIKGLYEGAQYSWKDVKINGRG